MIDITWYGHACVGLACSQAEVVLDPFSPEIGLRPLNVTADLVAYSHLNPKWHSYAAAVADYHLEINGLNLIHTPLTAYGIRFNALKVWEGRERTGDAVAMMMLYADGVRMAHFGDIGHAIGEREARWLRDCDVWFALAGGPPTIDLDDLVAAWQQIRPKVMIPIHFNTASLIGDFQPLDALLERVPESAVRWIGDSRVGLSPDTLPDEPQIWVLDPACDEPVARAEGVAG